MSIDKQLPAPHPVRIGKLDSMGRIRHEMARLYRAARRSCGPYPDAQSAGRLGYLLQLIARTLEGHELEDRLASLEKRMKDGS